MELQSRMVLAAQEAARRDSGSFRHWSGRPRCAACGRALARAERGIRIHGVPVHAGCAGFKIAGRAA